uniref:UDENN domain-containing protein n=1 Tax=Macrostomum lignano TaxID=282301 RepID=A0A1I8FMU8_9PLAT
DEFVRFCMLSSVRGVPRIMRSRQLCWQAFWLVSFKALRRARSRFPVPERAHAEHGAQMICLTFQSSLLERTAFSFVQAAKFLAARFFTLLHDLCHPYIANTTYSLEMDLYMQHRAATTRSYDAVTTASGPRDLLVAPRYEPTAHQPAGHHVLHANGTKSVIDAVEKILSNCGCTDPDYPLTADMKDAPFCAELKKPGQSTDAFSQKLALVPPQAENFTRLGQHTEAARALKSPDANAIRDNFLRLRVFRPDLSLTVTKEKLQITPETLISQIGGSFSLWGRPDGDHHSGAAGVRVLHGQAVRLLRLRRRLSERAVGEAGEAGDVAMPLAVYASVRSSGQLMIT